MIFVCGISKSGKTHLIDQLTSAGLPVEHVRLSGLLRAMGRPVVDLSPAEALENQRALAEHLSTHPQAIGRQTVLDGHAVIETSAGVIAVPMWFFSSIAPKAIAVVIAGARELSSRRDRSETSSVLLKLQDFERNRAAEAAEHIRADFFEIRSGDIVAMERLIRSAG